MEFKFQDWLNCPDCNSDEIGVLSYRAEMVLECYNCGLISEIEFGEDSPFQDFRLGFDDAPED